MDRPIRGGGDPSSVQVYREPPQPHGIERGRLKVCLVGEREAGKTSLATRFALGRLEGEYRSTQEAKSYRKRIGLQLPAGRFLLDLEIWDAPGDSRVFGLLHRAYFHQADGVFVVGDASSRDALEAMVSWIEVARAFAPWAFRALLINKADVPRLKVGPEAVVTVAQPYGMPWIFASARADRNVERAFVSMATWVLQRHLARRNRPAPMPLL